MALFNYFIEVYRGPLVEDAYGKHRDWANKTLVWSGYGSGVPYRRAWMADQATRETVLNRATLYLPGDIPVDSADHILFQGQTWVPEGQPWKWTLGSRKYTMINTKVVNK